MKVVHLVQFFQPGYVGGIQRYVSALVRHQLAQGLQVEVVSPILPHLNGAFGVVEPEVLARLPVHTVRSWVVWVRNPLTPRLARALKDLQADLLHLHAPSPALEMALLAVRPRIPLVVTLHNTFPNVHPLQRALAPLGRWLLGRTLRRAAAVIAPHLSFVDALLGPTARASLGPRLHFIPPGVDRALFRPLGLPRDPTAVLFVAHLRPEKGLHILVEALARLPDLRLEVLGAVHYQAHYFRAVYRRARRLLGERVRFRLHPSPQDLVDAYNRAGCFAVPSVGLESWNLALLEAASCGAPCVRSDLPGLAWADFALVVPPGDPLALADALRRAVRQGEELGRRALERASAFSWERTAAETLRVYREVG